MALLFLAVPEPKQVKYRVHLDLEPFDLRRDEEVEQLVGLGARLVDDQRRPDGTGWVMLADPEGNEFCIERSDVERAAGVERLGSVLAAGIARATRRPKIASRQIGHRAGRGARTIVRWSSVPESSIRHSGCPAPTARINGSPRNP